MKVKDEELGVIISRSMMIDTVFCVYHHFTTSLKRVVMTRKKSIDNVLKDVLVYKPLRRSQKLS